MAANTGSSGMSAEVAKIFDKLEPEFSARAIIRCDGKTQSFDVKKSDTKPIRIEDNSLTFASTELSIELQHSKAAIRIIRRSGPVEMAIHTSTGRGYVSTEDGRVYKTHQDGSVKIKKASKDRKAGYDPGDGPAHSYSRAYIYTEDGRTYKTHQEGSVTIDKAAKGHIKIHTRSSICTVV